MKYGLTKQEQKLLSLNYPQKGKQWCIDNLGFSDHQIRYYAQILDLPANNKFNPESNYKKGSSFRGKKRPEHSKLMKTKPCPATYFTQETRKKMSIASVLQLKGKNTYSRVKRGDYNINGKSMYFRSMWEANYALYLDFLIFTKQIRSWEFEPDTFWFEKIRRGVRSYTPDFKVITHNELVEYHEVKGWMDAKSKTKIKRMAKYYPDITLIVIDSKSYKDIIKKAPVKFYV